MSKQCKHCGESIPPQLNQSDFCCTGCEGAFNLLQGMGLQTYYNRKEVDENTRPLTPEAPLEIDFTPFITQDDTQQTNTIHLIVDGIHCAACVWLIETLLQKQEGVTYARLNMTTRRLTLTWLADKTDIQTLISVVHKVGYRLMPYDPNVLKSQEKEEEKRLLVYMAIAGFATANVMLLSVSVWDGGGMGDATKALMDWLSALIALPAIAYAGQPFYKSAIRSLKAGGINMDVPITMAIVTATGLSIYDTFMETGLTYYDSAIALVFFLLIGRFLDKRARNRASTSAENLTHLRVASASIIDASGTVKTIPAQNLQVGDIMLISKGEVIPTDAVITQGQTAVDNAAMTGESIPVTVSEGASITGGCLNVGSAIQAKVTATQENSTLSEITKLTEVALSCKAGKQQLADKAAQVYAPAVHIIALITFMAWLLMGQDIHSAATAAIAVLIVTCPCALALAIPAAQVTAHGTLMQRGIILKSPAALENMTNIKTALFDKTGTLTNPTMQLVQGADSPHLKTAVQMALNSRHPLSQALVKNYQGAELTPFTPVEEIAGEGLQYTNGETTYKLGRARFCHQPEDDEHTTLYFAINGALKATFTFEATLRTDAPETITALQHTGITCKMLTGDQHKIAQAVGARLSMAETDIHSALTPQQKHQMVKEAGHNGGTLMVGDGINDAPSLAAASVSFSFAEGADIARNSADVILSGWRLADIPFTLRVAKKADAIIQQNLTLSLVYNIVAIPLAMVGVITPLWAAVLMSSSSLLVMLNALRLKRTQ